MTPTISPAGSSFGYDFWKWLTRNKAYLKAILELMIAVLTYTAGLITNPALNAIATTAVTLIAKMGLDYIDFKYSTVVLTP
jgi:hypothetical protein